MIAAGGWKVFCTGTGPAEQCRLKGGAEASGGLSWTFAEDAPTSDDPTTENDGPGWSAFFKHKTTYRAVHSTNPAVPDRLQLSNTVAALMLWQPGTVLTPGEGNAFLPAGEGGGTALFVAPVFDLAADIHLLGERHLDAGKPAANKVTEEALYENGNLDLNVTVLETSGRPKGTYLAWDLGHATVWTPDKNRGSFIAFPRVDGRLASSGLLREVHVGGQFGTAQSSIGYDAKAANPDGTSGNLAWDFQGLGYDVWATARFAPIQGANRLNDADPLQLAVNLSWGDGWGDFEPRSGPTAEDKFDNSLLMSDVSAKTWIKNRVSIALGGGIAAVIKGRGEDDRFGWNLALASDFKASDTITPFLRFVYAQKRGEHQYPGGFVGEASTALAARRYGGQQGLGGEAPVERPPEVSNGADQTRSENLGFTTVELNLGADIKAGGITVTPNFAFVHSSARYANALSGNAGVIGLGLSWE